MQRDGLTGKKKARLFAVFNLILNLAILGLFKYYNFFAGSFSALLQSFGLHADSFTLKLILPVGISFYTFMALSYTFDVYKQKIVPPPLLVFFAYLTFFPQLLSGPIGRGTGLIPQFEQARRFDDSQAADGLRQFLWGLFKKAVVADNCATAVNAVWADPSAAGSGGLILASILYSFQIYCDFSGYSDMAIGVGRLFGIRLMKNFNYPYFSRSIAEFWRRWHISLTSWFRDYIYIPLGGSREGKWKSFRNTMIIFVLCGFWHGANWTFLVWGAFNGLLFLPLLLTGSNKKYKDTVAAGRLFPTLREVWLMGGTFLLASVAWVIFRADNIRQAGGYFYNLFVNDHSFEKPPGLFKTGIFLLILLVVEWTQRDRNHALEFLDGKWNTGVRWAFYLLLIYLIFKYSVPKGNFIYFQF